MASSSPIAKISRPVPAGFFPRKRLYRLLDRSRKSPLLWITGPPGCGKTTLVSSYIESRRLPCLWYKVDVGDADLATFFYYLGLAAKKAVPRSKKRLPLLTPDRLPGLTVFAHRYFESLSAMLPVPCLLVLDDCHHMKENPLFFETLREGVSRLAPGIVTALVGRGDPHLSFSRERANSLLEVFGWEELRLTPEETAGIVRIRRKGKSPPGLARDLFEQTDGWAAGLVLLLERDDRGLVEPRSIGKQVPLEIIDYFGSEVFHRQGEEMRGFLLRSAFLPKMTASMAERLTGVRTAGRILSEMNRHNLFTKKYLQREPVYEYHDLFREFLLEQASTAYSNEELRTIRKDAAAVLEESGYVEDAAAHLREAGDWEGLSQLILSQGESLVSQGRYQTLLEWLGALPGEMLKEEPWLLYWKGVCLMPFFPDDGRARFEEALDSFDMSGDAPGVFLSWSGAVDSILTDLSNYTPLDKWVSLLTQLLDRYGGIPPGEIGDRVTCCMFKALSFRQHPRAEVELWTCRALEVVKASTDIRLKVEVATAYFYCHQTAKGRYREAELTLASLKELLKHPDATPMTRLWMYHMEGSLSVYLSMPERCLRVVSEGLAFAESTGVHFVDPVLLGYGAIGSLRLGDFETASRYLRTMEAGLGVMKPLLSSLYHGIAAGEALVRRDLQNATFHSKQSLKLLEKTGNVVDLPISHLHVAHVHHELRENEEAAQHLAQARRICSEIESPHALWLIVLTEAYFQLGRESETSAVSLLREGLRIGREHGFIGSLLWRPGLLEKVAAKALEEGIEVEYVKDLIRRNRLSPDSSDRSLESWPWPVKVSTLGRFEFLVEERHVEFGRKVQQRPLSLLKALIALGGKEVSEGKLTELLWPEADGDMAHHSFTVALSRLRKLLGKEEALILKEGRLSLSRQHWWVDIWAFEHFLRQADNLRKEGKSIDAARNFEKALSLYQGPFLPFEERSWAVSPREKIRGRFQGAVVLLGKCFEEAGRWEEAASCYEKGLESDDLAEELYRRLMVCHIRRGQEAKALSVYRRCRKTLSSVLGVDPSAETRGIAESLGHPAG